MVCIIFFMLQNFYDDGTEEAIFQFYDIANITLNWLLFIKDNGRVWSIIFYSFYDYLEPSDVSHMPIIVWRKSIPNALIQRNARNYMEQTFVFSVGRMSYRTTSAYEE